MCQTLTRLVVVAIVVCTVSLATNCNFDTCSTARPDRRCYNSKCRQYYEYSWPSDSHRQSYGKRSEHSYQCADYDHPPTTGFILRESKRYDYRGRESIEYSFMKSVAYPECEGKMMTNHDLTGDPPFRKELLANCDFKGLEKDWIVCHYPLYTCEQSFYLTRKLGNGKLTREIMFYRYCSTTNVCRDHHFPGVNGSDYVEIVEKYPEIASCEVSSLFHSFGCNKHLTL